MRIVTDTDIIIMECKISSQKLKISENTAWYNPWEGNFHMKYNGAMKIKNT